MAKKKEPEKQGNEELFIALNLLLPPAVRL